MSDAKGGNNDPSMDDILASIRKIISDDEARAQVTAGGSPASPQSPPAGQDATRPAPPHPTQDDVLLLTDLVDEPPAEPRPPSKPILMPVPAAPSPRVDPGKAAEKPQPTIAAVTPSAPPIAVAAPIAPTISAVPPVKSVEPPVKQSPSDPSLVEPVAAGVAASAFDRLSQAVQEAVPPPAASDPGPSVGPSGRNLEDIVKELLKPMLKEWLDKNLPTMVERFVEREIVRLTRR
jgi:cell pole-organizing protein PopZ